MIQEQSKSNSRHLAASNKPEYLLDEKLMDESQKIETSQELRLSEEHASLLQSKQKQFWTEPASGHLVESQKSRNIHALNLEEKKSKK